MRPRPRCSIFTGGFDFSGSGDFTSCPPVERADMSNSEPSAIVLHGIPCIGGLYISLDSNGKNGSLEEYGDRRDVYLIFFPPETGERPVCPPVLPHTYFARAADAPSRFSSTSAAA